MISSYVGELDVEFAQDVTLEQIKAAIGIELVLDAVAT